MKRLTGVGFFVGLLVLLALVLGREAHAQTYIWNLVTLDEEGDVGLGSSIAVDANGDLMISYRDEIDEENENLKFTICDLSESTNGNCDQADDWSTVTVDEIGWTDSAGAVTSIAVEANGDPMIAYSDPSAGVKFAVCDRSSSANGNCDQTGDWSTVTVDGGAQMLSIAVATNGDPMISYSYYAGRILRFATCDLSESTNSNCDQASDWSKVSVQVDPPPYISVTDTSIAVDANGDPVIAYVGDGDLYRLNLRFAICDLSESTNGNCDQADDWSMVTVDETSTTLTSIAVDANGDPMIAYYRFGGGRKFAVCDLSESTNGNCDQATDWSTVTVDSTGGFWPSIAVDANGDPVVSHYDQTNGDLRFAACDLSESTNGNCDQATDWSTETVDATGDVGYWTSIAVNGSGEPVISYYDTTNGDLKFAAASSPPEPVGGVAELPEVGEEDSSARNFIVPAGFMAVGLLALTAGGWYARRRWLER